MSRIRTADEIALARIQAAVARAGPWTEEEVKEARGRAMWAQMRWLALMAKRKREFGPERRGYS